MNINRSIIVSDARRVMFVIGLLTAALVVFLSLTKQAAMQSDAPPVFDSTAQPDALGRLAFQRLNFPTTGSGKISLLAVNADGTGLTTLAAATTPPLVNAEPAWSPDGAKIAYVQDFEIFVMNADGSNKINITNNSVMGERNPSWSATNKIAYERESQIWTMNADGSNQTRFSAITQPSPLAPAWSPDGSKMAFASGGEIWVINADGTNERRVTNNSTADADPAWSPDGAKIIFGKGGSGIATVNLDGTNETNLTNGTQDAKPAWSSDGTKIAFVRRDGANGGIFTMDANGANQIRIVADQSTQPGRNENDNPAWQPVPAAPNSFTITGRITRAGASLSNVTVNLIGTTTAATTTDSLGNFQFGNLPQGGNYTITPVLANNVFTPPSRTFTNLAANQTADFAAGETCPTPNCRLNGRIAFVRGSDIFTMNSDGSNQTNITNSSATDTEPDYSPDGARIIFTSHRDGNYEIYRMNQDGTSPVRLTNNAAPDLSPAYSPDGSTILFVSYRDGDSASGIYKMNHDGTNPIRLSAAGVIADSVPSYSPDGAKIIFIRQLPLSQLRIFTMNADGTNQQEMPGNPIGFYNHPSYSPDGSKIIYIYGSDVTAQTIWTMNADGTNRQQFPIGRSTPTYSPNGAQVVHGCCFNGTFDGIRVTNADGSGSLRLTTLQDDLPDWQPLLSATRPAQFDFDGDGKSDISVFRPSNGLWYRLNSQNNSFYAVQFGQAGDKIAPADYDGDGKTDIAVFREGAFGYFYILNSSNNTFRFEQFGTTGDVPASGDWDGDAKADIAVYRGGAAGTQSNFFYRPSGMPGVNFRAINWGTGGDKPVASDYDGDGKFDAAVFRPSNGTWYVLRSSDNQFQFVQFGISTDIPVPADFDGDGKTDYAVFRPSTGTWFTSQNPATNYGAIRFGQAGDVPVPADYDGDGRADAAVFRSGAWYLLRSQAGFTGVTFGTSEDKPIPNSFVP